MLSLCRYVCLGLLIGGTTIPTQGAEPRTGEQIYKQLCANCHGPNGEGTEEHYPQGLVGDQSIGQLASLITRTMPLKAADKCVGEEARAVAEYIHHAFYSPTAQARNKPARIELSRLTVRQYQNSVTDLIGSFRPAVQRNAQQGLKGEYYKTRRQRKEDRLIERVDRQVQFDFGEGTPGSEGFEADEFSVRWQGSVLAPETGDYEFVLRTENGVRLWVNDQRQPLIDAGVKSVQVSSNCGSRSACSAAGSIRSALNSSNRNRRKRSGRQSPCSGDRPTWSTSRFPPGCCRRNGSPSRSSRRPVFLPMIAASAMNGGRRSPGPGTRRRPTQRSKPPAT